jgi:hypothetical protein
MQPEQLAANPPHVVHVAASVARKGNDRVEQDPRGKQAPDASEFPQNWQAGWLTQEPQDDLE